MNISITYSYFLFFKLFIIQVRVLLFIFSSFIFTLRLFSFLTKVFPAHLLSALSPAPISFRQHPPELGMWNLSCTTSYFHSIQFTSQSAGFRLVLPIAAVAFSLFCVLRSMVANTAPRKRADWLFSYPRQQLYRRWNTAAVYILTVSFKLPTRGSQTRIWFRYGGQVKSCCLEWSQQLLVLRALSNTQRNLHSLWIWVHILNY